MYQLSWLLIFWCILPFSKGFLVLLSSAQKSYLSMYYKHISKKTKFLWSFYLLVGKSFGWARFVFLWQFSWIKYVAIYLSWEGKMPWLILLEGLSFFCNLNYFTAFANYANTKHCSACYSYTNCIWRFWRYLCSLLDSVSLR